MATDYSGIIFLMHLLAMFLILIATVLCFLAPSYIVSPASTAATVVANQQTARSLLYGAGAIGAIMIILYIIYFIFLRTPAVDVNDPMSIIAATVGYGTYLLLAILIAMMLFMIFLIIYAYTLIDTSIVGNSTWWVIIAFVVVMIALIFEFVNIVLYYLNSNYLASLTKIEQVVSLQPVSKPASLADVFLFTRDPKTMNGKFNGTIAVEGELRESNQFIEYNGQLIENVEKPQVVPIKVKFPINEVPERIELKRPVMNQPREVVAPLESKAVVNTNVQRQRF
jgi:hypothetical protein